jgi:hypothetical protein
VALFLLSAGCAARWTKIENAAPKPVVPQPTGPTVGDATTTKAKLDGIVFTLPKTVLSVDLTFERKLETEGTYCRYNKLFWPWVKAPCTKKVDGTPKSDPPKPTIALSAMAVTTRGVPDPTKRFVLPVSSQIMVDSSDSIDLTESGTVSGAESTRTGRTTEVILASLDAAAGVAGKLMAAGSASPPPKAAPEAFIEQFVKGLAPPDADQLRSNYTLLTPDEQTEYDKLWKAPSADGYRDLLNARQAWLQISAAKARRTTLLEGKSNLGTGVTDMLKANTDLIDQLKNSAFLGGEKTTPWNPVFDVTPDEIKPAGWHASGYKLEITLFNMGEACFDAPNSSAKNSSLAKNSIPDAVTCKSGTPSARTPVTLRLEAADADQLAYVIDSYYDKPADPSYPFTIPASVKVSVSGIPENSSLPQTVAIAQWGTLNHLPVGKSSKGKTMKVTYYEATGALKSVKFGSDAPLNKGVIDSLAGSANAILDGKLKADATNAANAAASTAATAAATDELAKLTRLRQILEEKDKIAKLCAALGLSCSN